ncbi:MAG: hypothetical protein ACI8Y4_001238 [Candidatus Poriferisodalaceae bacterium]|jgi:hypothetical protein
MPVLQHRARDEEGSGLIPLTWGLLMFFMLLFLAVQIVINMYATSTVSALGHDAARRAAGAGATPAAMSDAESWFVGQLGDSVTVESIAWDRSGGSLSLSISVSPPNLMIGRIGLLDPIERTYSVRIEEPVPRGERL